MLILDQQVIIGGNDVSEYVMSIERKHSICETTASGSVRLAPSCTTSLNPYDTIVIYEQSTKVFTGFTSNISKEKASGDIIVDFNDTTIKLIDYWLQANIYTDGETAQHWIEYLCNLAGVAYDFETTLPVTIPSAGQDMATWTYTSSAMDIIKELITLNGYWMYTDADGTVHFSQGHYVPITITLKTGDNILSQRREQSITPARNSAIVFGRGVTAKDDKAVDFLTGVTKTAVIATPHIVTQADADTLAGRLVNAFARVKDEKYYKIPGDPDAHLAQFVNIYDEYFTISGTGQLTETKSSMTLKGYTMELVIDQYCPKLWGQWDNDPGDVANTLLVSYDPTIGSYLLMLPGIAWSENNWGLAVGKKGANSGIWSLADTKFVKVNGGMYSKDGFNNSWEENIVADPPNDWSDDPAPTIADLTWVQVIKDPNSSTYYGLAQWQNDSDEWRGWIVKWSGEWLTSWVSIVSYNELVTNGTFNTDISGWTDRSGAPDGCSWSAGRMQMVFRALSNTYAYQTITAPFAGTYTLTATFEGRPAAYTNTAEVAIAGSNKLTWPNPEIGTKSTDIYLSAGNHTLRIQGNFCQKSYLYGYWDNVSLRDGVGVQDSIYPIRMDIDQTDGSTLWLTLLNTTDEKIQLLRYATSDMSVTSRIDLETATEQNVIDKNYIAYPATTAIDKEYVYIFGRLDNLANLDTRTPVFIAGSGIQLQKSTDGGTTFVTTVAGWGADYCGAFTDQLSHLYFIRNGGTKGFYKKDGVGAIVLKGTPPFNTYVGSFTASTISQQFAIGSRDSSSVYQTSDDGVTWNSITYDLPAGSFISGLQYITEW